MRISVIVVSYNTRELLVRCLRSLPDSCELIVVDNASSDGSAEAAEALGVARVIRNTMNRGFGAANNQGLDVATGELVLLLNSDAAARPGAVERLAEVFADPTIVAAGGRLLGPDGETQNSTAGPLTLTAVFLEQTGLEKLLPGYWNTQKLLASGQDPAPTAQVMGACLMMRPVERFDERFFLYVEDTELCHRLAGHGRLVYVPSAIFEHELGASSRQDRWLAVARYNQGKELYLRLHRGPAAAAVCWVLNRAGALGRLLVWLLLSPFKVSARDQVRLWWRVLTARANRLRPPN